MDGNHGIQRDTALALSGGGYRATLFHLGSLIRLNELGWLKRLKRVTSVSGGSIAAAALALSWKYLNFDGNGVCTNLDRLVVAPVFALTNCCIDIPAFTGGLLRRALVLGTQKISETLASFYDLLLLKQAFTPSGGIPINPYQCRGWKHWTGSWLSSRRLPQPKLKDLPDPSLGNPEFIIYATNAQTGAGVRITRHGLYDYNLGILPMDDWPLSIAVAASSAFPPILSPVIASLNPGMRWKSCKWINSEPVIGVEVPEEYSEHHPWTRLLAEGADLSDTTVINRQIRTLQRIIVLQDGGVYDNLGLEAVTNCGFERDGSLNRDPGIGLLFVSDASYPMQIKCSLPANFYSQAMRSLDISFNQVRALRKRILLGDNYNLAHSIQQATIKLSNAGIPPAGAFWSAHSDPNSYYLSDAVIHKTAENQRLGRLPTRLCGFGGKLGGISCADRKRLVNWGWAMADTAIRKWVSHYPKPIVPQDFPFPGLPV